MSAAFCPRCRHELATRIDSGCTAWSCARCGGTWIDATTLRALAGGTSPPPGERAPERALSDEERPVLELAIDCPACGAPLRRLELAGDLPIDVCAVHGAWFDMGELRRAAKVFQVTEARSDAAARSPYARAFDKAWDALCSLFAWADDGGPTASSEVDAACILVNLVLHDHDRDHYD